MCTDWSLRPSVRRSASMCAVAKNRTVLSSVGVGSGLPHVLMDSDALARTSGGKGLAQH